ncbi:MAG: flagellar basal-body rod protein FlgF [Candidatus Sericytochromatia bacterium]
MIRGLYTSSAGMQVEQLRQESIANNLANLNTAGFKRDMTMIEARGDRAIKRTNNPADQGPLAATKKVGLGDLGTGVFVDRFVKDFEQGTMQQTENPFDLALQGDGFFTVEGEGGERVYTRGGDFTRDVEGRLVDKGGRAVLGQGGPITIPDGTLQVGLDGTVSVDGRAVDQLAIVRFDDPDNQLSKLGDTLFRNETGATALPSTAQVHQGMLEGANVNSVREMVEMIACLRQYEANQKAVHHQDETLAKAVNEVGRG